MKSICFIIISLILAVSLAGCSGTSETLEPDEYCVYKDGKLFLEIPTEDGCSAFELNTESVGYSSQFEGEIFTTKRGITIGSSLEDVLTAYKDVNWSVTAPTEAGFYTKEEFLVMEEDERPKAFNINISTEVIGDKYYNPQIYRDEKILEDLGIDLFELVDIRRYESEKYDYQKYGMLIALGGNEVAALLLSGMTSELWNSR